MLDQDERATRKAQLQKALSTAYLNHQISELESRVHAIDLPASQQDRAADSASSRGGRGGGRGGWGGGQGHGNGRGKGGGSRGNRDDKGRIDDSDEDGTREREGDTEWRLTVIDVSALLWAPKAVRRLVGKGWEVIVPLDAIRTLDLLKKGNTPTAQAARAAARYIEHASRHHRLLSADPSITVQLGTDYKRGRGLRLQRDDESRRPESVSELAMPPMDGDAKLPKWLTSVLSCAAFFVNVVEAEAVQTDRPEGEQDFDEPKAVLHVANPPLAVEVEMIEGERKGENGQSFTERGEGYLISQEAEKFELSLEVLRDEDEEDFGFHANRGRGKEHGHIGRGGGGRSADGLGRGGRGRGEHRGARGGRGGGRKQAEEPERAIKILLRRPQSNEEKSPSSNKSPLPSVFEPRAASEHLSPLPQTAQILPLSGPGSVPPPPPSHLSHSPFEHMSFPSPGHMPRPPPWHGPEPPPGHDGRPPPPPEHHHTPLPPGHVPRPPLWHGSHPPARHDGRPPTPLEHHHPSPPGQPPHFVPNHHQYPRPPPDTFRGDRVRGGRGRGGPDGFRGRGGSPERGRGGGFTLLQRPGLPPARPTFVESEAAPRVVLLQRPRR